MPGSRGVSHLTGRGSAGPSPSRRRARFRPPRGLARTHAAAGRPFLSIFALAAFCAPHMPLSATRTPFTHPVRPFPLPVRTPRARAQFFAPPPPRTRCACAAFPAAPTVRSASPTRGGPGRAQETPPSCPEGRGPSSAAAWPLPGLSTKDCGVPRPARGWGCPGGTLAPPLFPLFWGSLSSSYLSTGWPTWAVEFRPLDPAE